MVDQGEAVLLTPGVEQDVEFGLVEVGVGRAQASNLGAVQGAKSTDGDGGVAGVGGQGPRIAVGLGERLLPAIERAPADPEASQVAAWP